MPLCIFHNKMPKLQSYRSEDQLLKGCKQRDPETQRILFDQYKGRMMTLVSRYFGSNAEAEDILVRGFTKVFSTIESFRGEGSLEGWIRRIMINEALGQIRKEGASKWAVSMDELRSEPFSMAEIYDQLSTSELMDLIKSLPQGYRTVFNLFAVEGYSHREIGEMLGISEGTSKSQYLRSRNLLRKKVELMYQLPEYGS